MNLLNGVYFSRNIAFDLRPSLLPLNPNTPKRFLPITMSCKITKCFTTPKFDENRKFQILGFKRRVKEIKNETGDIKEELKDGNKQEREE